MAPRANWKGLWGGRARVRHVLYMAALSATKFRLHYQVTRTRGCDGRTREPDYANSCVYQKLRLARSADL
jgi:hypothetical protein